MNNQNNYIYNQPVKLSMVLGGKGTDGDFDLRAFSITMYHLINIIDNAHCVLEKQTRLSKDKRNELQISATSISRGSIHVDFDLIMAAAQVLAPFLGWANPYTIWDYTVKAYNFLKTIGTKSRNGEKPRVQVTDSPGAVNIGDNNTIIISNDIAKIASRCRENYRSMSDTLKEGEIEDLHIIPRDKTSNFESFALSHDETGIFTNPTVVDETTVTFEANILGFDKERLTGRLETLSNEVIPQGRYPFCVIGDQSPTLYANALSKPHVKITGLTEKVLDSIAGFKIKRIHVINVFLLESE